MKCFWGYADAMGRRETFLTYDMHSKITVQSPLIKTERKVVRIVIKTLTKECQKVWLHVGNIELKPWKLWCQHDNQNARLFEEKTIFWRKLVEVSIKSFGEPRYFEAEWDLDWSN